MRLVSGVLACVFAGTVSMAWAEDPLPDATNNAAPAATAAPAAPAAPAASAPTAAASAAPASAPKSSVTVTAAATPPPAPEVDQTDKHFLSEGYKIQMRNGEKKFCRREDQLGSRLGGAMTCSSGEELKQIETQASASVERAQHQQATGPTGR